MTCREKNKKPGDIFPVRDSFHYPLPTGLKDGTLVKLISFDHGYWTVEADARYFEVFAGRIDAGMEYLLDGRWLPQSDPGVLAKQRLATPAYHSAHSHLPAGILV